MAQRLAQGWRASPATLQQLSTQLLQALQALSQASGGPIAHNAITPDNIILRQTPQGLQACLADFTSAEQLPLGPADYSGSAERLPESESAQLSEPATFDGDEQIAARVSSHAAATSSSSSSWDVDVDVDLAPSVVRKSSLQAAIPALDAQLVTAPLSEALAINVEYAAPEALAGEARMGMSDAYSVGAVLAAAASGAAPSFSPAGGWVVPNGLQGTRQAAVIQRLLDRDWQRRLTPGQALGVLQGGPVPTMPAAQSPTIAATGKGIQVGIQHDLSNLSMCSGLPTMLLQHCF